MKMTLCRVSNAAFLAALAIGLAAVAPLARAQNAAPETTGAIGAKVWVVSLAQASDVVFPPPTATPDVTFTTNGIAYIGQQKSADSGRNCYTLGLWIAHCATVAYGVKFSGLPNPNLPGGGAAKGTTLMSGSTWGVMVEYVGQVYLTTGQEIVVYHDDGISLKINGALISGFSSGIGGYLPESVTYTGPTGTWPFDLLYANALPGGAWLLFGPYLCCG